MQCSFHFSHEVSCNTQAQAQPIRFSGYKGAEDLIGQLRFNPLAVIVHDKGNLIPFLPDAECNMRIMAGRHRIQCILQQVHQHLLGSYAAGEYHHVGSLRYIQSDIGVAEPVSHKQHCAIHQFIQRKWANDTAPPAGKPTHLLCDGTYTSRELHRRTKVTGNLVELPMCKMMLRVFRKCSNGRDWLIDLMHQSCGD